MTDQISFQWGPYGEIYPLPLVQGMTEAQCVAEVARRANEMGLSPEQVAALQQAAQEPVWDEENPWGEAAILLDGWRRRAALAGTLETVEARGLRFLVVERGEMMSLRPLLLEAQEFAGFAPVFYRHEGGWRVGLAEQGKVVDLTAESPDQALAQAQALYAQCLQDETLLLFDRGPFGEIYPLPLVAGLTGAECLTEYAQRAEEMGYPLQKIPTKGDSQEGMWRVATSVVDGWRRQAALGGALDSLEARALYYRVVQQGERMSLRPLGHERDEYVTFAPVFERVDNTGWRIGVEGQGKVQVLAIVDPRHALAEAQKICGGWMNEEEALLHEKARDDLPSLTSSYWALLIDALDSQQSLQLPNGWTIVRGRHDIYGVFMFGYGEGEGMVRYLEASAAVVARALILLAEAAKQPLPVPHPTVLLDLAMKCEPRLPLVNPVETSGEVLTWQGEAGEGRWELRYTTRALPPTGRWATIARVKGSKKADIATLVVGSKETFRGKVKTVQLRGWQEPLAGKILGEWAAGDFETLAKRVGAGAEAPLIWCLWELLQQLDKALAK